MQWLGMERTLKPKAAQRLNPSSQPHPWLHTSSSSWSSWPSCSAKATQLLSRGSCSSISSAHWRLPPESPPGTRPAPPAAQPPRASASLGAVGMATTLWGGHFSKLGPTEVRGESNSQNKIMEWRKERWMWDKGSALQEGQNRLWGWVELGFSLLMSAGFVCWATLICHTKLGPIPEAKKLLGLN